MSGLFANNALDVEEQASEWLERRQFSSWTAQDKAALDAWLAQSLAHEIAFLRLEAGWDRTERLAALRPSVSARPVLARLRNMRGRLAGFAAAIVLMAGLGSVGFHYLSAPSEHVFTTALGEQRTITLGDGSVIELNTGTVLRTRIGRNERYAELVRGEAFFNIVHEGKRPFTVDVAKHRVIDLGTKFLIRKNPNRLEVALIEGRAELKSADPEIQQHSVLLTPGDVAVASVSSLSVERATAREISNTLAWQKGVIVFNNTTLADAAAEFNRYNSRKIVIADPDIAGQAIYGTFQAGNVTAFARLAQDVLGLHVENRDRQIVISR